jgi:polysaccharide export protein
MRNINYLEDLQAGDTTAIANIATIRVKTDDKLSIVINSRDPQMANLFNLPIVTYRVGQTNIAPSNQEVSNYTVDSQGNIDFPVVGKIHVAGLSREEIAALVKSELITKNLVKDPVVTVEFTNHAISVLGEVNKPGRYGIDRDKITVLDALGMAGDLTIYGKREDILVLREEGGKQIPYKINLCSGRELLASPAYYLQQNDIVYVEPNNVRARQSTVNGNNVRSSSFWLSLASLLTTVIVLIVK